MKNTLSAAVAAAFIASTLALSLPSIADTPAPPSASSPQQGFRQHHRDPELAALGQLSLTDAQKTQIKGIIEAFRPKTQALRQDTTLTPDQKKDQMKAIRKDRRVQIFAVLTVVQRDQLKSILKADRANRHVGGAPGAGTGSNAGNGNPSNGDDF